MKKLFLLGIYMFYAGLAGLLAQVPFTAKEYVDVNKIKAAVLVHGDMWWNPLTQLPDCEFPKGSGRHADFAGSIWMAGYSQGSLYVAAQTYRQSGNDYWPGPVVPTGLTYDSSAKWAKIWKVDYMDIGRFKSTANHTVDNTPQVILEWPARNNPYAKGNNGSALTIPRDMAPFEDVDKDGSYDALKGDYPKLKGDQMLWWMFTDKGVTAHTNGQTAPMWIEVQAMAYAYERGTATSNMIFYELNVMNRSSVSLDSFRIGLWNDADIGYYLDDYIGFDSAHRMAYVYNALVPDGSGQLNAYGTSPPITGCVMLELPGDNSTTKVPVGSFMYYNNDNSYAGNPANGMDYNNYLSATFRDSVHLKNDFNGPGAATTGRTGPDANYAFPGDPSKFNEWSECASNNLARDARFVLGAKQISFAPGTGVKFSFAQVITDTSSKNTCPLDITVLRDLADTAIYVFNNPPQSRLSVPGVYVNRKLEMFPNPAHDILYIERSNVRNGELLKVFDVTGREVQISVHDEGSRLSLNTSILVPGTYTVTYSTGTEQRAGIFIKE